MRRNPLLARGAGLALDVALRIAWIGLCAVGSAAGAVHAVGARVEAWLERD